MTDRPNPPLGAIIFGRHPKYDKNTDLIWDGEKWIPLFTDDGRAWTDEAWAIRTKLMENTVIYGASHPEIYETKPPEEPPTDWIEVRETGDPLWKFHRGAWRYYGWKITDVKIGADGITLWIKVGKR